MTNRRDGNSAVINSGGAELHYVREGTGPPIVVIGISTYYPRAFSIKLRQKFELIFVDSRHFVPSYRPADEELDSITFETLADDVEAIRFHLGIDKWIVLGHSFQGQIALAYVKKYPGRTSRLVLVAGVPYSLAELGEVSENFWNKHASQERKQQHVANRSAIDSALAAAPQSRHFAVNYIGDAARYWADPKYDSTPLWKDVETGAAFGPLVERLPSRVEARSILEDLKTPTLLILGRLDYTIPHVAWEEIIGDLPHLTYVLLENESHNPQTESPERFDHELINWLKN